MKIAFFGLPLGALLLARDGHEIAVACISRTDGGGLRRLTKTLGASRVLVRPRLDEALRERVSRERPDLVVSWFWTSRLPMEVVRLAPFGGFGVHPSLLPRHRGPDPTTWAILAGDTVTGVTAHRLEEDYDTGAILKQEELDIDPAWDSFALAKALDRPSLRVLRAVAAAFARGEPPAEEPQRSEEATSAPFPEGDLLVVRWARPTDQILRQIRALAPSPGATTEMSGAIVTILQASACPAPSTLEAPGEAVLIKGRVLVRTLDGAIEILLAEVDGEPATPGDLARLFDA